MTKLVDLVRKTFESFIELRTDRIGQPSNKLHKILTEDELREIIFNSDLIPPEPNQFPTLFLMTTLLQKASEKSQEKSPKLRRPKFKREYRKILEFERNFREIFNSNLKTIKDIISAILSIVLLCGQLDVEATHESWGQLKLDSKTIYRAIKYLDTRSNTGRLALLLLSLPKDERKKAINMLKSNDKKEKRKVYGLACVLADILASAGLINVYSEEYIRHYVEQSDETDKELIGFRWTGGNLLERFSGLSLRPTAIVPIVSKVIDVIGVHNPRYVFETSSEVVRILSIVKNCISSCISQKVISTLIYEVTAKLNELRLKRISHLIDQKFYSKLEEELAETAILGDMIGIWKVDLDLILLNRTIRIYY